MVEVGAPPEDFVDLRPVKARFRVLYPPGHSIREAIEGEPDLLPRVEALPKLQSYARWVSAEADRNRRRAVGAASP